VTLATGRALLREKPDERYKIWVHNAEDDRDELNRRTIAICRHYRIPQEELVGHLFITTAEDFPLKIAHGYGELVIDTKLVSRIIRTITTNSIDIAMFDPLICLHNTTENDNGKMNQVIRTFGEIAKACDCSIDISHHTRKGPSGGGELGSSDARGASAVIDAIRLSRVLNVMSVKEGENSGLDELARLSYFRMDRGKSNTAPPSRVATWRKFENVELDNGDEVGVVTAWDHPNNPREAHVSDPKAEHVFLELLDKYQTTRKFDVGDRPGRRYAPSLFAEEPEAARSGVGYSHLLKAMNSLLDRGIIRIEEVRQARGRPTRVLRCN